MALLLVGPNPRSRPSAVLQILNGHISETVHPVLFVFCSRVKVQEKIMREEQLDWSQSKTFLVLHNYPAAEHYDIQNFEAKKHLSV